MTVQVLHDALVADGWRPERYTTEKLYYSKDYGGRPHGYLTPGALQGASFSICVTAKGAEFSAPVNRQFQECRLSGPGINLRSNKRVKETVYAE